MGKNLGVVGLLVLEGVVVFDCLCVLGGFVNVGNDVVCLYWMVVVV